MGTLPSKFSCKSKTYNKFKYRTYYNGLETTPLGSGHNGLVSKPKEKEYRCGCGLVNSRLCAHHIRLGWT